MLCIYLVLFAIALDLHVIGRRGRVLKRQPWHCVIKHRHTKYQVMGQPLILTFYAVFLLFSCCTAVKIIEIASINIPKYSKNCFEVFPSANEVIIKRIRPNVNDRSAKLVARPGDRHDVLNNEDREHLTVSVLHFERIVQYTGPLHDRSFAKVFKNRNVPRPAENALAQGDIILIAIPDEGKLVTEQVDALMELGHQAIENLSKIRLDGYHWDPSIPILHEHQSLFCAILIIGDDIYTMNHHYPHYGIHSFNHSEKLIIEYHAPGTFLDGYGYTFSLESGEIIGMALRNTDGSIHSEFTHKAPWWPCRVSAFHEEWVLIVYPLRGLTASEVIGVSQLTKSFNRQDPLGCLLSVANSPYAHLLSAYAIALNATPGQSVLYFPTFRSRHEFVPSLMELERYGSPRSLELDDFDIDLDESDNTD